jgi:DNA-binding transcriptional LysR family regulator
VIHVNIKRLEYFVKLADTLNFTKAASECFIVQTAMSRQISALEDELGVILFKRDTRSVELTNVGKEFYWHALKLIADYEHAIERVSLVSKNVNSSLRIGIGPYEQALLQPILKEFLKKNPEVLLYIEQHNYETLARHFQEGRYDLMVCINHCAARARDCEKKVIYNGPWGVILSINNPLASKEELVDTDLKGLTLINMSEYNIEEYKQDMTQRFSTSKFMYVNSISGKLLMVGVNIGFAWIPEFISQQLPPDIKYHRMGQGTNRHFVTAYTEDRLSNPALSSLLTFM